VTTKKTIGKLAQDLTEAELIAEVKDYIEQADSLITLRQGSDRPYLRVDGWQYIIQKHGLIPLPDDAIPLEEGGFLVRCTLVDEEGVIKGRGEMSCGSKGDSPWDKRSENNQRAMAQTRSIGRAGRNRFSWLVVACGYSATPAEELPDDDTQMISYQTQSAPAPTSNGTVQVEDTGDHRCPYHNTEWTQSERMRGMNMGHSHSLGKDMGWCNQKDVALSMNKELSDIGKTIVETIGVTEEEARETVRRYLEEKFKKSWPDLTFAEAKQALDDLSEVHAGSYPADNDPSSPKNIERSLL